LPIVLCAKFAIDCDSSALTDSACNPTNAVATMAAAALTRTIVNATETH
jgi:hypothetical protein